MFNSFGVSYLGQVIVAVTLYWFVSISLVFVNKFVLNSGKLNLSIPLFVTWFQCFISVILCLFFSKLGQHVRWIRFPKLTFEISKIVKVLPLSIVMLLMITFNNYCLKNVNVSFYFISRSLTTVFNVIFTYLFLKTATSMRVIVCCGVIMFGFWLGVDEEDKIGTMSWAGLVFGVAASAFVALNAILTKKMISQVAEESVWRLCFYNNINACWLFLPLIFLSGETTSILQVFNNATRSFWLLMLVSGLFGFAIGYVTGLQIQVTSPLSHNVSGTAKACAQTLLAVAVYMEHKSLLWWMGNIIVMSGSLIYVALRGGEMRGGKNRPPPSSNLSRNIILPLAYMSKKRPL